MNLVNLQLNFTTYRQYRVTLMCNTAAPCRVYCLALYRPMQVFSLG